MAPQQSPAVRYQFTWNNYPLDHENTLTDFYDNHCKYLVYQKEVGETTGTPHLQGFFILSSKKRISGLSSLLPGLHFTKVGGKKTDLIQSINYCKKKETRVEGTEPLELGDHGSDQGSRSDLTSFQDYVKQGNLSLKRIREEFPDVAAKYPRYVEQYIRDNMERPVPEMHPLRQWQQDLYKLLQGPVHPREVIFVVDRHGNGGKSWFSDYYEHMNPEKSFLVNPGKTTDMVYTLYSACVQPRVIFIDVPRSRQDQEKLALIPYEFAENCKNGRMTNTKYTSETFYFKKPHVVIFTNQHPDEDKLSADRYKIITI